MTKYNSTYYRIIPLMEYLSNNLDKLNELMMLLNVSFTTSPIEIKYGDDEKLLKPKKEFLIKILDYIRTIDPSLLEYKKSRHELYFENRDLKTKEAKERIEKIYDTLKPNSKLWYIFEEFTHPDIFIEGDDYIIIGEGKWTEKSNTTHTTNLPKRCQMIRHIEGALNYSNKKVYAFYLVDKDCGYLNDLTKEALATQIDEETIKILDNDKKLILDSFYGYITWQDINKVFPDIKFKTKEEINNEHKK